MINNPTLFNSQTLVKVIIMFLHSLKKCRLFYDHDFSQDRHMSLHVVSILIEGFSFQGQACHLMPLSWRSILRPRNPVKWKVSAGNTTRTVLNHYSCSRSGTSIRKKLKMT